MTHLSTLALLKVAFLVSWFTAMGLVSLWAACAPRQWFLRAFVALMALAAWLLAAAYEPIILFGSQMAFVATAMLAYRRRRARCALSEQTPIADERGRQHLRFSLREFLLMSAIVALVVFIGTQIPRDVWNRSPTLMAGGTVLAIVTLGAAWTVYVESVLSRKAATILMSMFIVPIAVSLVGPFLLFLMPNENLLIVMELGVFDPLLSAVLFGIAVVITLILLTAALALMNSFRRRLGAAAQQRPSTAHKLRRRLASAAFAMLLVLVFTPPAVTIWSLSRPLATIDSLLPDHNGRDVLMELSKRFPPPRFEKSNPAGEEHAPGFIEVRQALELPYGTPMRFGSSPQTEDKDEEDWNALRRLAWALNVRANALTNAGNVDEALPCCLDDLKLADAIRQGGLIFDNKCASGAEWYGLNGIFHALPHMSAAQCRMTIAAIALHDKSRTAAEVVISRQWNWYRRQRGWAGYINMQMFGLTRVGDEYWDRIRLRRIVFPRERALVQLLMTELAVRAYYLDHGQLPSELAKLVPEYLAAVPEDPFAAQSRPLQYSVSNDDCRISSVGLPAPQDTAEERFLFHQREQPGQLSLESYFGVNINN